MLSLRSTVTRLCSTIRSEARQLDRASVPIPFVSWRQHSINKRSTMFTTSKRLVSSTPFTGDEIASTFFSKPEFTGIEKHDIKYYDWLAALMEDEGFNLKTVRQVFEEAGSREAAINTLKILPIRQSEIERYYVMLQSIEDRLAEKGIIALSSQQEIEVINELYTPLTLSRTQIEQSLATDSETGHITPSIFMVLGSSGSGKTFFSVKDLPASIHLDKDIKRATVYLLPGYLIDSFSRSKSTKDPNVAPFQTTLLQYIKEKIEYMFQLKIVTPLKMHLTIVMDEAGSGILEGYFEVKNNLDSLHTDLKTNLATSVWLVVCGTGLHGNGLSSRENMRKFRMGLWTDREADELLQSFKSFPNDEIPGLIHALSPQATLQALLTNARSAFFLLKSIERSYQRLLIWRESVNWVDQLRILTPALIVSVVAEYINNNALRGKSPEDLFCVAASVFRAVEEGRNKAETSPPMFLDLPFQLRHIAKALIDLNVEVSSGGEVTYIQTERTSSVLVSPAIVIVLVSLLGVQAGVLSRSNTQELITALVVFRERARSMYDAILERGNLDAFQQRWAMEKAVSIDKLENSLLRRDLYGYEREKAMILTTDLDFHDKFGMFQEKLDLVKLLEPDSEGSNSKTIYIPIVDNEVTCINGERAPFADVLLPRVQRRLFFQPRKSYGNAAF